MIKTRVSSVTLLHVILFCLQIKDMFYTQLEVMNKLAKMNVIITCFYMCVVNLK